MRFNYSLSGFITCQSVSDGENETSRVMSCKGFCCFVSETATEGMNRNMSQRITRISHGKTYVLDPVIMTTLPVRSGQVTTGKVVYWDRIKLPSVYFMVVCVEVSAASREMDGTWRGGGGFIYRKEGCDAACTKDERLIKSLGSMNTW
jgi:hypothetical protein